jgi:hypothetical protein
MERAWPSAGGQPRQLKPRGRTPREWLPIRAADFAAHAEVLNSFPSADALALARFLGVRYVVIRTRLRRHVTPAERPN